MRTMKNSGIEWIGEIPAGWKVKKIKHSFSIIAGATPKSEVPEFWDGDIAWITPADYKTADVYVAGGKRNLSQAGYDSCGTTLIPSGSIVFSKRAPIGSVAINTNDLCTNQGCLSCVPRCECVTKYFYYMMSVFTEIFNLFGTGTTFKEISVDNFANFSLPFPDITEQHQIVSYLDQKCTEVDAVIAKTKATIEEYKKLKQSIITEAVTKGIRGDRPMKDSGIEWIGDIPTHWQVVPHKYVMHKEKTICEHYGGEDIISLTMNGVIVRDLSAGGKMPTTFDGYQYVEPEDLLLCLFDIDVTPRCVGIVRNYGVTSPAYSRFKVHEGYHNAYYDYLLRFIDDEKVFIHLSKNLRSSLTETDFGAIKTIVPPLYEQKEIADYLSKKCAEMDTLIARKTALLAEMESYKKSVIYEYVTGKKEVV